LPEAEGQGAKVGEEMKYVYLVWCNENPLLYSVNAKLKSAYRHVKILIKHRNEMAIRNGAVCKVDIRNKIPPRKFPYYRNFCRNFYIYYAHLSFDKDIGFGLYCPIYIEEWPVH
jgi:hypothetical protein